MFGTAAWAQQPRALKLERTDFFREILSKNPSPKTVYYNTDVEGSYRMLKLDTVRGLSETAKSQNLDLRATLVIGPYGPTNVGYVYVFLTEKSLIRVNQLTVAASRITYKSTGTMTRVQYDRFLDGLIATNVFVSGLPDDESRYEMLLARWSNGRIDSYYGSTINPRPGANVNQFSKSLSGLLYSLNKTYPLSLHAQKARPPG